MKLSLFLCLLAMPCSASVTIYNGTTNSVQVNFPVGAVLLVPANNSLTFEPTDEESQGATVTVREEDTFGDIIDDEPAVAFSDGMALGYNGQGIFMDTPGAEKSVAETDSDLAGYFMNGLEAGSALAATLLGFIAVRRALSLGDNWND
jgi:hypothetical protein